MSSRASWTPLRTDSTTTVKPILPAQGLRLAVMGKGSSGKSVLAGTMARPLGPTRTPGAGPGFGSDAGPGDKPGMGAVADAMLTEAVDQRDDGRWRLKRGIGAARAVQRYARPGPDGVRLLIEVARRVIELAVTRELNTVLVANQVGCGQDIGLIEAGLGRPPDWVLPHDPVVVLSERHRRAPIDLDGASSAGVSSAVCPSISAPQGRSYLTRTPSSA